MEFREVSLAELQPKRNGVIRKLLNFIGRNFFKFSTLVLLATTIVTGFLAYKYYNQIYAGASDQSNVTSSPSSNTASVNDATQLAKIRADFERIAVVPTGEEPSIGQIVDADQLRVQNPTFYADAKDGDALFIYSKKAYIFRPTENKVVNAAPVNRQTDTQK